MKLHKPSPPRNGFVLLGEKLSGAGRKAVAVVKGVDTDQVVAIAGDAHVQAAAVAVVQSEGAKRPPRRVAAATPTSEPAAAAAPAPAAMPQPTRATTRPSRPASTQVAMQLTLRNGQHSCKAYSSLDSCNSACTSQLRADAMSTSKTAVQSCSCSDAGGC